VLWLVNRKVYGAHKLWKAARRAGHDVGRDQVARLMRELGIRGVSRRRKVFTTRQDPDAWRAPDLVNRDFTADRPDALWVTDLTYVPTRSGMAYVCLIVDAFSRRIVGWRVAANMKTEMVLDALEMARVSRGGRRLVGLVAHSDAGSQFTSVRFTERLDEIGARPSIGTVADSYDKALVSYCTSWCRFGVDSFGEAAAHAFDEPGVAGGGRLEEPLVLVVGLVGDEQAGVVPGLDGRGVYAEALGDLAEREQPAGPEAFGVAGQAVAVA
jgi:Integrase core domain/HTH-like domain